MTLQDLDVMIGDVENRLSVLKELREREQLLLSKLMIDRDILDTENVLDEFD